MVTQKKMLATVTRQTPRCPIFGLPKELRGTNLPTHEDVLLSYLDENFKISKQKVPFSTIADNFATQIATTYCKASIPVLSHARIVKMIKAYHDIYNKLTKSYNRDQEKQWLKTEKFVAEAK
ncbi:hypothetical protein AVEN_55994-1 [Araneus ventricosus]|uniref:Uncharacterized protein n=1 Tax=Araneus ventricosus TaxID=182803 RepID=A0A4Y2JPB3_ARAVE|nr:hypothetical protein AVEN_55994-1 [Araneus ventricosus]